MSDQDPGFGDRILDEATGRNLDLRSLLLVPSLAVLLALVIGALVMLASGESISTVGEAFGALLQGAFGSIGALSETLTNAAPLILAGLAVGLGFRAGLFNIGAEGQILLGGMSALFVAFTFDGLPLAIHLPLALIGGILGGAIFGAIPGWLRAQTGAHEVITTIMLNFVAYGLINYLLKRSPFQEAGRSDPVSQQAADSARLPQLLDWIDPQYRLHAGFIVALLAVWFTWWVLFRSTKGFEFRAVGMNPDAARYAGIRVNWSYVLVMAIGGGLAGLAGSSQILGVLGRATPGFSASIGFDAIALALLGRSHPIGILLAGLLFGALKAGGQEMQASAGIGIDIVEVIQSLIIMFIAAPAHIRAVFRVGVDAEAEQITQGWST